MLDPGLFFTRGLLKRETDAAGVEAGGQAATQLNELIRGVSLSHYALSHCLH